MVGVYGLGLRVATRGVEGQGLSVPEVFAWVVVLVLNVYSPRCLRVWCSQGLGSTLRKTGFRVGGVEGLGISGSGVYLAEDREAPQFSLEAIDRGPPARRATRADPVESLFGKCQFQSYPRLSPRPLESPRDAVEVVWASAQQMIPDN